MHMKKETVSDRVHFIMSEIAENDRVTQRELSSRLGVSVSTVNVLLAKMVKEGLVKMNQVSTRQVFYMLTPAGMLEKAKKTVGYLKGHYRVFYETKERLKVLFEELSDSYDLFFVLRPEDEMGEILSIAVEEYTALLKDNKKASHAKMRCIQKEDLKAKKPTSILEEDPKQAAVLLHMEIEGLDALQDGLPPGLSVVNLLDVL